LNWKILSSKTKAIIMTGLIMAAAAVSAINVIIPYLLQNVYAFSLKESQIIWLLSETES
jgi:hypothetical protein